MNLLNDTLNTLRQGFVQRAAASVIQIAGYTILACMSLPVFLGIVLVEWSWNIRTRLSS